MSRRGEKLLIVGASARAAAMSAVRSGIECAAADRFADADLQEIAATIKIDDYPAGLIAAAVAAPAGPWMYTGAIENRPELVDQISRSRRLYGIRGESLRTVRDPFRLADVLLAAGLKAPRCSRSSEGLPRDGTWLHKPTNSAGGCGIAVWDKRMASDLAAPPPHPRPLSRKGRGEDICPQAFFQESIDGTPLGAVYVAAAGRAMLLGVTKPLSGLDWCGLPTDRAHQFRYCGSVGPISLTPELVEAFQRIGDVLAGEFDLVGLFGVDAILADDDVWPVEVNPRYTASVEVLERAVGIRSISLHVAACEREEIAAAPFERRKFCGKAILFAERGRMISQEFFAWCRQLNHRGDWPAVADSPSPGTLVLAGQPIVTVLAEAASETEVLQSLRSLAAAAYGKFAKCAKNDQKSHSISPNLLRQ